MGVDQAAEPNTNSCRRAAKRVAECDHLDRAQSYKAPSRTRPDTRQQSGLTYSNRVLATSATHVASQTCLMCAPSSETIVALAGAVSHAKRMFDFGRKRDRCHARSMLIVSLLLTTTMVADQRSEVCTGRKTRDKFSIDGLEVASRASGTRKRRCNNLIA